ncbi:MAG: HD domain-containing protein, partial [Acidimicrobiales bacterium]
VWGADVALAALNLCDETLDGVRNHSWSRPAPMTPEGEVVSWADRIAYVCHDWEDAVSAGIVTPGQLPAEVRRRCGTSRSSQLGAFITAMVDAALDTGRIGMDEETAEALAAFRRCNYELVYLRPASRQQAGAVISVLRALVEHFADHPGRIPDVAEAGGLPAGSEPALRAAVAYVAGMTDRFAMSCAVTELGWDAARLPRGVDGSGITTH